MCKNLKGITKTLAEFDVLLDDILSSDTITVDGEETRAMTDLDRVELIQSVWLETTLKLTKYKIDLD